MELEVPDPEKLGSNIERSCTQIRNDLIIKQRAIILSRLIYLNPYPSEILPNQEKIFSLIHKIPNETSTVTTPQQTQFISSLISFLYSKIDIVSQIMEKTYENSFSRFLFLASSSIPALFGFFSSSELVDFAYKFYVTIIQKVPTDYQIILLEPFFLSACTYRFIEAIFVRFGIPFCHEPTKNPMNPQIEKQFILQFSNEISKCYPLLPDTHQRLFQCMLLTGWRKKDIASFFLNKFLFPQLRLKVQSSPYTHQVKTLSLFFDNCLKNSNFSNDICTLFSTNSYFEIPFAYSSFDCPYLQLLISVADIYYILISLKDIDQVPTSAQRLLDTQQFPKINLDSFWLKYYPKTQKIMSQFDCWRSVVFEEQHPPAPKPNPKFEKMYRMISKGIEVHDVDQDFNDFYQKKKLYQFSKKATLFERYLKFQLSIRDLQSWDNLVEACHVMIVLPLALQRANSYYEKEILIMFIEKKASVDDVINKLSKPINSFFMKRSQYLFLLEKLLPFILPDELKKLLKQLEKKWSNLIEVMRTEIKLPSEFKVNLSLNSTNLLHKSLWEGIEHLSTLSVVPFHKSFDILIESINHFSLLFDYLIDPSCVLKFALVFCQCPSIISTFIKLSSLFVKTPRFDAMNPVQNEYDNWCLFESNMLKIIENQPIFLSQLIDALSEMSAIEI